MPTTSNFGWTTPADTDLVKNGALAIRTLGNGIDTSLLDLKGGTTGQILSKASNTDLDYTWINNDQGDITEVQAGTGISVASGTGPIPIVTNTVATAFDAKGDLVAGTGADTFAKLTVGADNTVLTADSTTATGLKWASPSTGLSWTLLNSGGTALTGAATITISGISNYDQILVLFSGASSANSSSTIGVRINGDTAANYDGYGIRSVAGSTYSNSNYGREDNGGDTVFRLTGLSSNAASTSAGYCLITGASKTTVKVLNGAGGASPAGGADQISFVSGGLYKGTSAVTSVSLFSSSGNFDAGTLWIYGA